MVLFKSEISGYLIPIQERHTIGTQVSTVISTFIELSDHEAFPLGILISTIKYFLGIKKASFLVDGDNVDIDDNEICHRSAI